MSRAGRLSQRGAGGRLARLGAATALSLLAPAASLAEEPAATSSVVVSSPYANVSRTVPAVPTRIDLPGIVAEIGPDEGAPPAALPAVISSPHALLPGSPRPAPPPPALETQVASLVVPSLDPPEAAPRAKAPAKAPAARSAGRPDPPPVSAAPPRDADLVRRSARIAGVVSSTLYEAVRSLGESPQLASDIAELFAWDVDFSRRAQTGDQFAVLYERLYKRGPDGAASSYVGPGRILAARYEGQVGRHSAVYFETDATRGGYFRPDGSAIERQFMLAPLKYTRVSSRFSPARYHPILKVSRPHHGIDYAAATGTPIVAVADGRVIFRGRAGGYGNLVKVRHSNGYVSYYAHMSRFRDGLKVGDAVHQKQVLGYVGSTGLSTGPHVCFRVAKDGRFVDPASLRTPGGNPVPPSRLGEFVMARDALFEQLDGGARIVTEEAF